MLGLMRRSGFVVYFNDRRGDAMTSQPQEPGSGIPDLRGFPLDRLAELGGSVLAHSIDVYRQRIQDNGVPLCSFTSRI
jgi:hypothetical protein